MHRRPTFNSHRSFFQEMTKLPRSPIVPFPMLIISPWLLVAAFVVITEKDFSKRSQENDRQMQRLEQAIKAQMEKKATEDDKELLKKQFTNNPLSMFYQKEYYVYKS